MRVTVFHNPDAGSEELDRERLLAMLEDAGYGSDYHSTKREGWKKALEEPADLVVAAGGDGTVAKIARRLAGRGIPLAVLPLGTANNIASSLGVGRDSERTIARWATATPSPIDLALATGPWGEKYIVEATGVGILPRLFLESATRVPKNTTPVPEQIPRNIELLLEILHESRPSRLDVDLDGRDLSGEHLMVEAMNIRSIGPRLDLAPDADPGDGLLDVVIVPESDRDLLATMLRHRLGGRCDDVKLTRLRGERLTIRGARPPVHLDDKPWPEAAESGNGDGSRVTVEVQMLAGAIQVLC
jgi:diacylglycerol kinase family enzyme